MTSRPKADLLTLLRHIPLGRVTTAESLAGEIGIPAPLAATMLAQLTDDERDLVPWHRVVAKGGAIGRGLHRDQQFARLVREGVMVSPAGIVQDLARHLLVSLDAASLKSASRVEPPAEGRPPGRSRGMKQRP
ncbi:MAG: MGMT family protein [Proteobacteria bacterium]|nr:MGMT family protein [Pseudomonadota bacterium]